MMQTSTFKYPEPAIEDFTIAQKIAAFCELQKLGDDILITCLGNWTFRIGGFHKSGDALFDMNTMELHTRYDRVDKIDPENLLHNLEALTLPALK